MSSLKKQFISSIFYTAGAKYTSLAIQLVITGILSRILRPEDFGVIAIATVFILFFSLLGDIGVGTAIIQNKTLSQREIEDIFSFSIFIGILLAGIFYVSADTIASFYQKAELGRICRILSVNILFSCFNVVPNAILLREKKFKFIAMRTLLIQILSGSLGIASAYIGLGVYALIVYAIAASGMLFLLNYLKHPLVLRLNIRLTAIRKIFKYSLFQFLFNFINYFSRNLDKLLIGKFLSPVILGFYDKSYRLMMLPVENLTMVLAPVVHPLFSDFQHDKQRIFDNYMKIVRVLALAGLPLSVFLYFTADELVFVFFGKQWAAAVPPFKILAWSVGVQIVLSSSGSIFQAANDTKKLFLSGLLSAIIMITGMLYGVFIAQSLNGVAYGLLFAFCINFVQCFFILIRMLGGNFLTFIRLFRIPVLLAVLVFIFESLLSRFAIINQQIVSLFVKSLVMGIAILAGLVISGEYRNLMGSMKTLLKR